MALEMKLGQGSNEDSEVEIEPGFLKHKDERVYLLDRAAEQKYLAAKQAIDLENHRKFQEKIAEKEKESRKEYRLDDLALGHILGLVLSAGALPLVQPEGKYLLLGLGSLAYFAVMSVALNIYCSHKYPSPYIPSGWGQALCRNRREGC